MTVRAEWFIIATLASLGIGCTTPDRQSAAVQIAVDQPVRGITPSYSLYFAESQTSGAVFESLTERDSLGEAIPWLAKRWVSPDSQTWTFTLQNGVRFHDGSPFRAADVIRSWTALVADSTDGDEPPSMFMLVRGAADVRARTAKTIAGLTATDDTTLRVELSRREPGFVRALGSRRLGVTAERSAPWAPLGTGPWRFVSREGGAAVLRFARWDGYWSRRAASESLLVRHVPDRALKSAFAAGLVDCASDLLDVAVVGLASSRALRLIESPAFLRDRVLLNFANPALRDIRVRRALLLAIDREALLRVREGFAGIVTDMAVPPSLAPGILLPVTTYDPDSARRLLAAAGYTTAHPLHIRTVAADQATGVRAATRVLDDYWKVIGVQVSATGSSSDENPRRRPAADVEEVTEEPGIKTAEDYLNLEAIEGPYRVQKDVRAWENARFASLYRVARTSRVPVARDSAVREMIRLAYDSLPSLTLSFQGSLSAQSLRVSDCSERMPRYGTSRILR